MSDTFGSLLAEGRKRLAGAGIDSPGLDARLLLEEATGADHARLISHPDRAVGEDEANRYRAMIDRRAAREPLHRIVGHRSFYGLDLRLNAATLVPRPDTEVLVDTVLPMVQATCDKAGACRVLDIGTGSGAIALAILSIEARAVATGSDVSDDALAMAWENAKVHGLAHRFKTVRADVFEGVEGAFDMIVSNPPYIRSEEIGHLMPEVAAGDPLLALEGGPDGLDFYRRIAAGAGDHLAFAGQVAVEFGALQLADVSAIFAARGYRRVRAARDLGGNDRAALFERAE